MALRRKHSVERTGVELLRAWAAAAGGAPVGRQRSPPTSSEDLAIAADRRPGDLVSAASRFGGQAGDDGWPLARDRPLARDPGPHQRLRSRQGLLTYEVAVALSAGWTRRVPARLRPARTASTRRHRPGPRHRPRASPAAGLRALRGAGVEPDLVYRLRGGRRLSGRARRCSSATRRRVALADEVEELFGTGETIAGRRRPGARPGEPHAASSTYRVAILDRRRAHAQPAAPRPDRHWVERRSRRRGPASLRRRPDGLITFRARVQGLPSRACRHRGGQLGSRKATAGERQL